MTTTSNTKQHINAIHMQYVEPMKMLSESGENTIMTMSAVCSVMLCQESTRLSVLPEPTQSTHILSFYSSFLLVSLTTRPQVTINICYPVSFIAWRSQTKKERIRKGHPQSVTETVSKLKGNLGNHYWTGRSA